MTAQKICNLTRGSLTDKNNNLEFLPYCKNYAEELHGSTLYENLKYYHDLGERRYYFPEDSCTPQVYEYRTYAEFRGWYGVENKDIETTWHRLDLEVFKALKCYQLKALYNFPEYATVGEVKQALLIPLIDKLLDCTYVLATTMFINRLSSELISLEVFIFCTDTIEWENLKDIMCSSSLAQFNYKLIDSKKNNNYWFYRFYCQIFLNSNVLTGTARTISFSTKPYEEVASILDFSMKDRITIPKDIDGSPAYYYSGWAHIFNADLNGVCMDWLEIISRSYHFYQFFKSDDIKWGSSDPSDYCLLLQKNVWDPD